MPHVCGSAVAALFMKRRPNHIELHVVWGQFDGLVQRGDGPVNFFRPFVSPGKVYITKRLRRPELDRLLKIGDGVVPAVLAAVVTGYLAWGGWSRRS